MRSVLRKHHFRNSFLLLIALILISLVLIPESRSSIGTWVEYQLPYDLPDSRTSVFGEELLLYASYDENLLVVYDLNISQWVDFTAPTTLRWNSRAAGDDVAMIWNDSLVVAYSAVSHSFVPLTFQGNHVGGPTAGYGATGSLAWFLTDERLYVFHAFDAQWYDYGYTHPGTPSFNLLPPIEGGDYLMVAVQNPTGQRTTVAFSGYTRTFAQLLAGDHVTKALDLGFLVYPAFSSSFTSIGGYSAYTGQFDLVHSPEAHPTPVLSSYGGHSSINTTAFFAWNELLGPDSYRRILYGFDTRHGNLAYADYNFAWVTGPHNPFRITVGGQIALEAVQVVPPPHQDPIGYYIYSGDTNAYRFFESPLIYPTLSTTCVPSSAQHCVGTAVFAGWDCSTFMFYDTLGRTLDTAPRIGDLQEAYVSNDWGCITTGVSGVDTVNIYSYHASNNELLHFAERAEYASLINMPNVAGVYTRRSGGNAVYIYLPGSDSWVEVELGADTFASAGFFTRDYLAVNDQNANVLRVFDGVVGSEQQFTHGGPKTDIIATNALALGHNLNGDYVGYSTHTRNVSPYYPHEKVSMTAAGYVALGRDAPHYLVYNALHDCFVPMDLTPEQGSRKDERTGPRTALVTTRYGSLLAFDPNLVEVNTQAGQGVVVELGAGVSVTFEEVMNDGITQLAIRPEGPPLPAGLRLATQPPSHYEITTTATWSGELGVCVDYDETKLVGNESDLSMLHYVGAQWTDITGARIPEVDRICGETTSLSLFALGVVEATGVTPDHYLPSEFRLQPPHPNPFNPLTRLDYELPRASSVQLAVYDAAGRRVRDLLRLPRQDAGLHRVSWDGRDDTGGRVASGVYFVRLSAGEFVATERVVLIK